MKRNLKAFIAILFISSCVFPQLTFAKVYTNPIQETAIESSAQSQPPSEAERTQELLAIWKEHVKTLTKERDEAYLQIEAMKNQGVGSATQPSESKAQNMSNEERESAVRAINDLKAKVQALQSENEQLKMAQPRDVAAVDQDLKNELTNLRNENQKLKLAAKENVEAESDKEVILREKEEALRDLEKMKDKMTLLQKKYDKLNASQNSDEQNNFDPAQVAALQAKADKLKIVEAELKEARNYFASYMKDLDAKNQAITEENKSLKSQMKSIQMGSEKEQELEQSLNQMKSENDSLLSANKELKKIQSQQAKTIQTLKSSIKSSLDSLDSNSGNEKK